MASDAEIFNYVVRTLLGFDDQHPVQGWLNDNFLTTPDDIFFLDADDIEIASYRSDDGNGGTIVTPISIKHKRKIKDLIMMKNQMEQETDDADGTFTYQQLMAVGVDDFAEYRRAVRRVSFGLPKTSGRNSGRMSSLGAASVVSTESTRSAAESFRYGIKKDPDSYPEMTETKTFAHWREQVIAIGTMHGMADCFNESLDTSRWTNEQRDELTAHTQFLYTVLMSKIKVSEAKAILRQNAMDGRGAMIALKAKYMDSAEAQLDIANLRQELATMNVEKFRGTSKQFLLAWNNKWETFDKIALNATTTYTNEVRLSMLKAAVMGSKMAKDIDAAELVRISTGGAALSYTQYKTALGAKAHVLQSEENATRRASRTANESNRSDQNNSSERGNGTSRETRNDSDKPRHKYEMLPKDVWNKMSDQAKEEYRKKQKEKRKSSDGGGNSDTSRRRNRDNNKTESTSRGTGGSNEKSSSDDQTDKSTSQPREANVAQREIADIIEDPTTGARYERIMKVHKLQYRHTMANQRSSKTGSLVDGGANGGFAGSDVRFESTTSNVADITGLADKKVHDVPIGTALGTVMSTSGPIILVMNQYALYGKGKTIHSIGQMEAFGLDVDDRSKRTPNQGKDKNRRPRTQCIKTPDGYVIPLAIRNGLAIMDMSPTTDEELETLPRVMVTSDENWDPSVLDGEWDLEESNPELKAHKVNEDLRVDYMGNYVDPDPHDEEKDICLSAYTQDVTPINQIYPANDFGGIMAIGTSAPFACYDDVMDIEVNVMAKGENGRKVTFADDVKPANYEYIPSPDGNADVAVEGFKTWDVIIDAHQRIAKEGMKTRSKDKEKHTFKFQDRRDNEKVRVQTTSPEKSVEVKEPAYEALRSKLGWKPADVIKKTFAATTQFFRNSYRLPFRKHYKSRFPSANVSRRNETVATDTMYSDTPAIGNGAKACQVYVGRSSLVTDIYPMMTDKYFFKTLEDCIRQRGAPEVLMSDNAKAQTGKKVQDITRMYRTKHVTCEPHHQHQNFAENRIGTLKDMTNNVMDRSGCPPSCWLLALMYVTLLLNHLAHQSLNWRTPLEALTGQTPDISAFLEFEFFQPVYFAADNKFPSQSPEQKGRWVGIAESTGDVLTYKILTDDTQEIIHRSAVRPAGDPDATHPTHPVNKRLDAPSPGETASSPHVKLHFEPEGGKGEYQAPSLEPIDVDDLIGRTFLTEEDENGRIHRARVVKQIQEDDENNFKATKKFLVTYDDDEIDAIIGYAELMDSLAKTMEQQDDEGFHQWKFRSIVGHQNVKSGDPNYMGSSINLHVLWEDGTKTYEPLDIMAKDAPETCAEYAIENKLVNKPGWKRFKRYARNKKKLIRELHQAKLKSQRRSVKYMYGYQVPRDVREALELDKQNGNTKWRDSINLEIQQLMDYKTFVDKGKGRVNLPGYQFIRCHMVFAVKHDGRHKARFVAGGHLTNDPVEAVYSGVVSIRSLKLVLMLAELNNLNVECGDIGNAYLEAKTSELVAFIGGPEFDDFGLNGHTLVIHKALYGLKSSGKRWSERFADVMREEGFFQSKADSCVWMRENKGVYEYVAAYVDDLACAMHDAAGFLKKLTDHHKFKLKGVGPISFHLGCDFTRDPDNTLVMQPKKYIEKMIGSYERLFGEKPKEFNSPLAKGDHPELDDTELCNEKDKAIYMSLIGSLQWLITLGRYDISCAVASMSRFRPAPRAGHLERAKRIYGYVKKFKDAAIRFRTGEPNYSDLPNKTYDWMYTVYGNVEEQLPSDAPKPLGKPVVTSSYYDANLMHCLVTGRAMTGVMHFVNQTLIDTYSKRQATVATATFGSEFVAAKQCTEQVIELRNALRYLGVPVRKTSYVFGDNQSVVTQSTIPHSQLAKRMYALAYHRVREAVAAGIIAMHHVPGKINPSDVLTKFLGYQEAWHLVQPILHWRGDTATLQTKGSDSAKLREDNPMHIARVLSVAKQSHKDQKKVLVTSVTDGKVNRAKKGNHSGARMTNRDRATTVRVVKNLDGFTKVHSRLAKRKPTSSRSISINTNLQSRSKPILGNDTARTSSNAEVDAKAPIKVKSFILGATFKAHNSNIKKY